MTVERKLRCDGFECDEDHPIEHDQLDELGGVGWWWAGVVLCGWSGWDGGDVKFLCRGSTSDLELAMRMLRDDSVLTVRLSDGGGEFVVLRRAAFERIERGEAKVEP
jgi:hypothetical protein